MSLRRNASEWLDLQRLGTDITSIPEKITVCDSRVLLIGRGRHMLYVFDVSAKHTLRDAANVTAIFVQRGHCTRIDNDTLVASTYGNKVTFVSLQRLASLPLLLEPLASVNFTATYPLLFPGDLLLVADWNRAAGSYAIRPLCRFARRATRSLNGECSSMLRPVLT